MRLSNPYELISDQFPISLIADLRKTITEPDWFAYDYRKSMFPSSTNDIYDSILIRHSSEYSTKTIRNMPLYEKYATVINPILDFIRQFYRVDDYVAFLSRLGPEGVIATHRDSGEFLERVHRLHIPIQTNSDCFYLVENNTVHMKVGTLYEIDNQREHGVVNQGTSDRIQLVVNVYGDRSATHN
jgi:Aspartyl/Asparaginyl beta-hydroxylase